MDDSIYAEARQRAVEGMEIAEYARLVPERVAVRSAGGELSYAELNAQANQIAHFLRAQGVAEGDKVALLCSNRLEFVVVRFATYRIGAVLTPVNWHLTPEEITYIVDNSDAKVLFADVGVAEAAARLAQQCRALTARVSIGGSLNGFLDWGAVLGDFPSRNVDHPKLGGMMLYTSGTTGRPKGVARTQPDAQRVTAMIAATLNAFQFDPDSGTDLALTSGPLYHTGPFNLSMTFPLIAGIGTVLMDQWEPELTLQLVQQHRITHGFFVPTMFHRLLQLPEAVRSQYDTGSLKFVLHSAAPCPVPIKQAMLDWWGPVIWEMMATTEGPGTLVSPQEWLTKPGTVGQPQPGQIIILDAAGSPVAPGQTGTLYWINPPDSRFEYYKDADKTTANSRDGYFTAGDIGYLDDDGYLFLSGRDADTIIAGGVNIYPQEIDNIILQHPAVQDVACVGVPNEEWGEEIKAVVQLTADVSASDITAASILQFARQRLAKHKWPRSIDFADNLPRTETGKIQRHRLRDRYWQGAIQI
ncbi:MAG: AMP-binding protein [Pseudomonadota bacterium]|nr:AMP-binding protein [Pseudomonadota bacterium]